GGAAGAVFGMLALNGLPMLFHPLFNSKAFERVTSDRFYISIEARDPKFDREGSQRFLRGLGAVHVEGGAWGTLRRPTSWSCRRSPSPKGRDGTGSPGSAWPCRSWGSPRRRRCLRALRIAPPTPGSSPSSSSSASRWGRCSSCWCCSPPRRDGG